MKLSLAEVTKFTEDHGQYVDYENKWSGIGNDGKEKIGWRVFDKSGEFSGLLSEDKAVLWWINGPIAPYGMDLETKIRSILECVFSESKTELIDLATIRILEEVRK